jgi:hypothetical protein
MTVKMTLQVSLQKMEAWNMYQERPNLESTPHHFSLNLAKTKNKLVHFRRSLYLVGQMTSSFSWEW